VAADLRSLSHQTFDIRTRYFSSRHYQFVLELSFFIVLISLPGAYLDNFILLKIGSETLYLMVSSVDLRRWKSWW